MVAADVSGNDVAVIAGVILAGVALLRLVIQKGFGSLSLKAGPVSLDVKAAERIEQKIDQINNAVNHVAPGTPAIPERLSTIEGQLAAIVARLDDMDARAARHHPEDFK